MPDDLQRLADDGCPNHGPAAPFVVPPGTMILTSGHIIIPGVPHPTPEQKQAVVDSFLKGRQGEPRNYAFEYKPADAQPR